MESLTSININKPIAFCVDGPSAHDIDDWQAIKDYFYIVAINCFDRVKPDLWCWSDIPFYTKYLANIKKECLYAQRFHADIDYRDQIDFEWKPENIPYISSTTIEVLQILRKCSDQPIYIFGMDLKGRQRIIVGDGSEEKETPRYDGYMRGTLFTINNIVNKNRSFFKNVFNCSMDSLLDCFPKVNYKEVLNGC